MFEVGLKRVGPGVFFALFGAFVLYTSLDRPVQMGTSNTPSNATWIPPIDDVLAAIEKLAADLPAEKKSALLSEVDKLRIRSVGNFECGTGQYWKPLNTPRSSSPVEDPG